MANFTEFKGVDLSCRYVTPSTWNWLADMADDDTAANTVDAIDNGYGLLLWTYSFDEDGDDVPSDLRVIIREAYDRDWRFIFLGEDASLCDLFPDYFGLWAEEGKISI